MTDEEIRQKTKNLLIANTRQGHNVEIEKDYCYISPSPSTYPYQWFWDTCFHVFILCALGDYDLAKRNMESLFTMQLEDGFVGHMLFWESTFVNHVLTFVQSKPHPRVYIPHMSSIIQPPLAAQAALRIYEHTKDKNLLSEILPKLKRYHWWLRVNRDFEGNGLLSIISPFESGMDFKPSFDEVLNFKHGIANELLFEDVLWVDVRNFLNNYDLKKIYKENYFIVKEVGFNTFYTLDLLAMAQLCKADQDQEELLYKKLAKKVTDSMRDLMYDEEEAAYFDIYGNDNKKIRIITPTIFFPAVLPDIPLSSVRSMIDRHLANTKEFVTNYPIPSDSMDDPAFQPNEAIYLWRGPTWIIFNWMLYRSLLTKGYEKFGERIYQSMHRLIEKSGFREYYNPFTGEGYGAKNFTWSGLIVDMINIRRELNST